MTISNNTIVRNGMPFIGKVLEQVAPYMEEMIVTVSKKSSDDTLKELERIKGLFPDKLIIDFEDVVSSSQLTEIRNKQVKKTKSDWILFLDDDDYWPKEQLELCLAELDKDQNILAYSVSPYQLIDREHYDTSWNNKFFSKFLRREGLRYIKPWPRDLPADKENKPLYWKWHSQVKNLPYKFYHLSYLKDKSFRSEEWAEKYKFKIGKSEKLLNYVEI